MFTLDILAKEIAKFTEDFKRVIKDITDQII